MRCSTLPRKLLECCLSLLAPAACAGCGGETRSAFCANCGGVAPAPSFELEGVPVFAAGAYAPPLSDAIRRWKFENHPELTRPLAGELVPVTTTLRGQVDRFVPVPLHRERLVERGYNQAALLARELARSLGGRVAARTLARSRGTAQQARLSRREREENVREAFLVRGTAPRGRLVLVDDVITTGATAGACLAALRLAGAEVVAVVTLARAVNRPNEQ